MLDTRGLTWLEEAVKHIGLNEVKGVRHSPTILSWLDHLGAWWSDDETAWCGTFVAHCLRVAGLAYPKQWYRALDYANYGLPLSKPVYGCIAVLKRAGGGHVGFVVGENEKGDLLLLGGNQNNAVNISAFSKERVVCYVFPKGEHPYVMHENLNIGTANYSQSEA